MAGGVKNAESSGKTRFKVVKGGLFRAHFGPNRASLGAFEFILIEFALESDRKRPLRPKSDVRHTSTEQPGEEPHESQPGFRVAFAQACFDNSIGCLFPHAERTMSAKRVVLWSVVGAAVIATSVATCTAFQKEYKSGIVWPEPTIVTPGATDGDPPSDADRPLRRQGPLEVEQRRQVAGQGRLRRRRRGPTSPTKDSFGDCQLHVEFATPEKVAGSGQGRGNSGVFLAQPLRGPGPRLVRQQDLLRRPVRQRSTSRRRRWSTPAASRANGRPTTSSSPPRGSPTTARSLKPGYVTVIHNGVLVQNHFELLGDTFYDQPPAYAKHPDKLPIRLQYHGNPVRFRNIWIREIKTIEGKKPE